MRFSFTILLSTLITSIWTQTPDYAKNWNKIKPDTSIYYSGKDTAYTITEWWLKSGNEVNQLTLRNSISLCSYYVNSTKEHFKQHITETKNGDVISITDYQKSGVTKVTYDSYGNPLSTYLSSDNGETFYLLSKKEYHSKKKRTVTYYYSNGNIRSQGKEVRAKIIAGCDSGMYVFVKHGIWLYYNEDGSLKEKRKEEIKSYVYSIE